MRKVQRMYSKRQVMNVLKRIRRKVFDLGGKYHQDHDPEELTSTCGEASEALNEAEIFVMDEMSKLSK